MSEPIPESIPTSADRRSHRPVKKARMDTPHAQQSAQLDALFAKPDKAVVIAHGPASKPAVAPPEIVANVQGSSAGAGSGEFHVYKASRRREYERLRAMDEEAATETADAEHAERQARLRAEEAEKLSKNRAKREKAKARAARKKAGAREGGVGDDGDGGGGGGGGEGMVKKRLGARSTATLGGGGADGAEADGEEHVEERGATGGITFVDDD